MKRFFTALLSVSLALTFILSSGCSSATTLSFNNAFNGKNEPYSEYWETMTYSVSSGNYKEITRSNSIPKDVADFSINGELKISFRTITESDIPADVKDATNITLSGKIYHLKSELKLNSNYTVNGKNSGEHVDEILNEVIFLTTENAFAPIFSFVKQSYSVMVAKNSAENLTVDVETLESECKTIYKSNSYTITKINDEKTISNTYDYDFRTLIDNTQLLFALRNLSLEKEKSTSILTVSPVYGKATPLLIKNNEESSQNVKLNINGEEISESLSIKNLSFSVNDSKNTGTPQYVTIQKSSSEKISSKALMLEYVHPLICYGNFTQMGALIYKLTSAQYSV